MRFSVVLASAYLAGSALAAPYWVTEVETVVVTATAQPEVQKAADDVVYVTETAAPVSGGRRKKHGHNYGQPPAPSSTKPAAPPPSPSPPAPSQPSYDTPSDDFAATVLKKHNDIRALHGSPALQWDDKLASKAQEVADKCVFEHSGSGYGENLAAASGDKPDNAGDPITLWHKEEQELGASAYTNYNHFTQLIWKDSTKLGCAIKTCGPHQQVGFDWSDNSYIFVCEYDPAGNVQGYFDANLAPPSTPHSDDQW